MDTDRDTKQNKVKKDIMRQKGGSRAPVFVVGSNHCMWWCIKEKTNKQTCRPAGYHMNTGLRSAINLMALHNIKTQCLGWIAHPMSARFNGKVNKHSCLQKKIASSTQNITLESNPIVYSTKDFNLFSIKSNWKGDSFLWTKIWK